MNKVLVALTALVAGAVLVANDASARGGGGGGGHGGGGHGGGFGSGGFGGGFDGDHGGGLGGSHDGGFSGGFGGGFGGIRGGMGARGFRGGGWDYGNDDRYVDPTYGYGYPYSVDGYPYYSTAGSACYVVHHPYRNARGHAVTRWETVCP
jgi:hypothetical protein